MKQSQLLSDIRLYINTLLSDRIDIALDLSDSLIQEIKNPKYKLNEMNPEMVEFFRGLSLSLSQETLAGYKEYLIGYLDETLQYFNEPSEVVIFRIKQYANKIIESWTVDNVDEVIIAILELDCLFKKLSCHLLDETTKDLYKAIASELENVVIIRQNEIIHINEFEKTNTYKYLIKLKDRLILSSNSIIDMLNN